MKAGNTITFELADEAATEALARTIAGQALVGDRLALKGDLGAGKTVFARAFIRCLCGDDIEVPSPTFTLVQTYEARDGLPLFHFDLYRLEDPEEVLELDIDDAFAEGISLIEWPERMGYLLPRDLLEVALSYGESENQRVCVITAPEKWVPRLGEIKG